MGLAELDVYISNTPWIFAAAVGVRVLGRVIVALAATRGADPGNKPEILRAVGDMFRPLSWGGGSRHSKGDIDFSPQVPADHDTRNTIGVDKHHE